MRIFIPPSEPAKCGALTVAQRKRLEHFSASWLKRRRRNGGGTQLVEVQIARLLLLIDEELDYKSRAAVLHQAGISHSQIESLVRNLRFHPSPLTLLAALAKVAKLELDMSYISNRSSA